MTSMLRVITERGNYARYTRLRDFCVFFTVFNQSRVIIEIIFKRRDDGNCFLLA